MNLKTLVVSAFLVLTLSGCVGSGSKLPEPSLPAIPADLRVCFDKTVAPPKTGPLTKRDVVVLVARLKQSEQDKTECGKRLIAFYESISG